MPEDNKKQNNNNNRERDRDVKIIQIYCLTY